MAFSYSSGVGHIFTIDNRDYFIISMTAHDHYNGSLNAEYRMIYKDSHGEMQERLFRCSVRFPGGEKHELSIMSDNPLFVFLASNEINATGFITNLCFSKDYSFVIPDYKESMWSTPIDHNVIAYITMIKK